MIQFEKGKKMYILEIERYCSWNRQASISLWNDVGWSTMWKYALQCKTRAFLLKATYNINRMQRMEGEKEGARVPTKSQVI